MKEPGGKIDFLWLDIGRLGTPQLHYLIGRSFTMAFSPTSSPPTTIIQQPLSSSQYPPNLERYLQASFPSHPTASGQHPRHPRYPQYPHHHALPARPRSAVIHDSRAYLQDPQYLDRRSSLASHAYSLPPRLAPQQPYTPSTKPASRASRPTSTVFEDEKAGVFAQQLPDDDNSIHPSSPSRPATPSRYAASDYASSDGSTIDETPTVRQTMRSLVSLLHLCLLLYSS